VRRLPLRGRARPALTPRRSGAARPARVVDVPGAAAGAVEH
jgi:hypothetical protein